MTAITHAVVGLGTALRGIDRVWVTLVLFFATLAIFLPQQAIASLDFTVDSFLWILPFLLVSVALAAWLKAAGADQMIGAAVSRSLPRTIVLAAAFGAFSPFCSCGVVPLVAALLAAGVPLPAVMAFWLASPIMDPEMFVLMVAAIGMPFTLAKTAAALGMGLFAGFATMGLQRLGAFADPLKKAVVSCGSSCDTGGSGPDLKKPALHWRFWQDTARRALFFGEARTVALFLGKWMLLAFALESLMVAWLPGELVADYLGGSDWSAVPLAVVVGVPAYLNGYAAIPLVGELMEMGMAPGAALAFMVAGGVTSLPASMAVFAVVRAPVFLGYLSLAMVGSLLVGFSYQAVLAL